MRYWEDEKEYIDHSEGEPEWDVDSEEWFKVIPRSPTTMAFKEMRSPTDIVIGDIITFDRYSQVKDIFDGLSEGLTIKWLTGNSSGYSVEIVLKNDNEEHSKVIPDESEEPEKKFSKILSFVLDLDEKSDQEIVRIIRKIALDHYS